MTTRERVAQLLKAWPKIYPGAHCELDFRNPLQLLVATILSAQSTDKRVNMVTPVLFRKYRTAKDYADAPLPELEDAIRSTGFYRNKAKSIRDAMREIVEKHDGGAMRVARRWSKDGKRCSRQRLSQKRRHRGRHARDPAVAAARPNETKRSSED
jgi:endonuclease III